MSKYLFLLLIFLLTNPLNTVEGNPSCDDKWDDGHSVKLGCLKMERTATKHTFIRAKKECEKENARLVEILNNKQMEFMVEKMREKCELGTGDCEWWGGANKKSYGMWHWVESGKKVDPVIWINGEEPPLPNPDLQYNSCFKPQFEYYGTGCRGGEKLLRICQRK